MNEDFNYFAKKMILMAVLLSCAFAFQIQGIQNTPQLKDSQKHNSIDFKAQEKLRWQIRKNAKRPQHMKKSPLLSTVLGKTQNLIKQKQLNGNMLLIDNYLLFSKNTQEQYPTIRKLNLKTMQLQTINYPEISEFDIYQALVLADLKNGDIALGGGEYILIIDKNTFKLKQAIKGQSWDSKVLKFNVYVDGDSKERIIVQRGTFKQGVKQFYELKKIDGSGQYSQIFLTYSPSASWAILSSFQLTSQYEAVSVSGYDISYWQNLNSIIDISYDKKYLLGELQYIATSRSQNLVVLRNNNKIYQIYRINDNYELVLQKSLNISYGYHQKGQFTSDEKQLFISSTYNTSISYVNLETGAIIKLSDTDPQKDLIDFYLFARETDRMIVLASKKKEYFLQLRSISTLKIIHEIPLKSQFQVVAQKLIGNIQWGLNFNLASASSGGYFVFANSVMEQYTITDDKIVKTDISGKFHYSSLKSCNKYFIVLDPYTKNTLEVRYFSNFSVAKTIQSTQTYYIAVMNDFMVLGSQSVTLYDFSRSLEPKGIFFKSNERLYFQLNLLLPKRGVFMDLTTAQYFRDSIMRAVYNISKPQIRAIEKINDTQNRIGGQLYFQPFPSIPQMIIDSPCNKVYYLQFDGDENSKADALKANTAARLVEYDECQKKISKYPIQFTESWHERLLISSDKKYFIIVMEQYVYNSDKFYIEIRARENLSEILLQKEFSLGQLYNYESIIYFDVDIVNDCQLIVKSNNFVYTTDIKLNSDSRNLQTDQ